MREDPDAHHRLAGERYLIAYYGSATGGRSVDVPCGTLTTHDRYAIIDGQRMRWLSVEEQLEIMSFPADYRMPGDRRLATHLLGNAVCPKVMTKLVRDSSGLTPAPTAPPSSATPAAR